jgi:hypothetical protein
MTRSTPSSDLLDLETEIARYLDAVETFRAEGSCPTWRPELAPPAWWASEHLPEPRSAAPVC